jgi:modulator of FtsH protease
MEQQVLNQTQTMSSDAQKVLRNTYMLLAMTLAFSAVMAGLSMSAGIGYGASIGMSIAAIVLVWFVLPKVANSAMGLPVTFLFTGLMGGSIGPMLNHYLAMQGGTEIVMQALGGTAIVFFSLSAYVNTTKKDFTFMRGFLFTGLILGVTASIGMLVASMLGYNVAPFSLAISGLFVLLMSGFILYDTSSIIRGEQTNYIMATVGLYLNIHMLFVHLLHILGATSDD